MADGTTLNGKLPIQGQAGQSLQGIIDTMRQVPKMIPLETDTQGTQPASSPKQHNHRTEPLPGVRATREAVDVGGALIGSGVVGGDDIQSGSGVHARQQQRRGQGLE